MKKVMHTMHALTKQQESAPASPTISITLILCAGLIILLLITSTDCSRRASAVQTRVPEFRAASSGLYAVPAPDAGQSVQWRRCGYYLR